MNELFEDYINRWENEPSQIRSELPLLLGKIKIERVWAMPNKWTFTIKPIKKLLWEELCPGCKNNNDDRDRYISGWCDPFAGNNSWAEIRNDINGKTDAQYNLDALSFLKRMYSNNFIGVLYDPPYSITQARMYGKKEFSSMKYWADCKNEIARIIKPGGKAICFGWNSMGLGKNRGFEMTRILLVAHGGSKNDTIVTVETKLYPPQRR